MEIKLKDLLEAGCHFGHQVTRWNPKMKSYIFAARDNVHIFDLVQTKKGLEEAGEFLKETAAKGGKIIFIGTKKQAKDIIKEAAIKVGMPYVSERWIGGTLTNWEVIKRNLDKLKDLRQKRDAGELKEFTKKERLLIDREIIKLEQTFGGIQALEALPEAVFIVDVKKEIGAAKEAKIKGVKVVGVVDTNSDPDLVDYLIPANDDAVKSIKLIVDYLTEAVADGNAKCKKQNAKIEKTDEKVTEETKETVEKGSKTKKTKKVKKEKLKNESGTEEENI